MRAGDIIVPITVYRATQAGDVAETAEVHYAPARAAPGVGFADLHAKIFCVGPEFSQGLPEVFGEISAADVQRM
jgi:hypothetical protein